MYFVECKNLQYYKTREFFLCAVVTCWQATVVSVVLLCILFYGIVVSCPELYGFSSKTLPLNNCLLSLRPSPNVLWWSLKWHHFYFASNLAIC